jgi:hypothetical protein
MKKISFIFLLLFYGCGQDRIVEKPVPAPTPNPKPIEEPIPGDKPSYQKQLNTTQRVPCILNS